MLALHRCLAASFVFVGLASCDGDVLVGEFQPVGSGGTLSVGGSGGGGGTQTSGEGGSAECVPVPCLGQYYKCGNCVDDDMDGEVDSRDANCLGPCHDSEIGYFGSSVQNAGNCGKDCYFDQDAGAGNDGCHWDHRCDPLEPSASCGYEPDAKVGSPPMSCAEAQNSISEECRQACLPLVPNGCDCFGCCIIQGNPVWLGSELDGSPSCTSDFLDDPERCRPCTPVAGCFNDCEECEVCVGKPDLPASCLTGEDRPPQNCPEDAVACGLVGQAECTQDHYCITGCCILTIK